MRRLSRLFFKILSITSSLHFLLRSSCLFTTYGKCALPLRVIGKLEANMWKPARDQEQVREGGVLVCRPSAPGVWAPSALLSHSHPPRTREACLDAPAGLPAFRARLPLHAGQVLGLSPADLGPECCVVGRRVLSSVRSLCPLSANITPLCDNQDCLRALPGATQGHGPHRLQPPLWPGRLSLLHSLLPLPGMPDHLGNFSLQNRHITRVRKKKLTSIRKKRNIQLEYCLVLLKTLFITLSFASFSLILFLSPLQSTLATVPEIDDCQCGRVLCEQLCCVGGVAFL